MDFIRTPRTSKSFTHRVLVVIGDESMPPAWSAIPADTRSKAEPRLNAWIARLIGDPTRFAFSASVSTSGAATNLRASLSEIGLSPLSLVMACEAPGKDSPSELEERLAQLFASKVEAPAPGTQISHSRHSARWCTWIRCASLTAAVDLCAGDDPTRRERERSLAPAGWKR
jgi:hypothetical protein